MSAALIPHCHRIKYIQFLGLGCGYQGGTRRTSLPTNVIEQGNAQLWARVTMRPPAPDHLLKWLESCLAWPALYPGEQLSVSDQPLEEVLSHRSMLQWPLHQMSNCQWATLSRPFSQLSAEWWSKGREWGKRQILAFSLGPPAHPALIQRVGWGLYSGWTQSQPWQPNGSSLLPGTLSAGPGPTVWAAWGAWEPGA